MQIKYSPQRPLNDQTIKYAFDGESITVEIDGVKDIFDFSGLPDGELDMEQPIETVLPVCPIINAKRTEGELWIELLYWYPRDMPKKEIWSLVEWRDTNGQDPVGNARTKATEG